VQHRAAPARIGLPDQWKATGYTKIDGSGRVTGAEDKGPVKPVGKGFLSSRYHQNERRLALRDKAEGFRSSARATMAPWPLAAPIERSRRMYDDSGREEALKARFP
jgi:hypothetical protein